MTFIAIMIVGVVAITKIPVSLMPDIAIPEITVQVRNENTSVRELENSIEHAVVLARDSKIEVRDLPSAVVNAGGRVGFSQEMPRRSSIAEREKELLAEALQKCGWNKKEAAKQLGISRNTLYQKLKRYKMSKPTAH